MPHSAVKAHLKHTGRCARSTAALCRRNARARTGRACTRRVRTASSSSAFVICSSCVCIHSSNGTCAKACLGHRSLTSAGPPLPAGRAATPCPTKHRVWSAHLCERVRIGDFARRRVRRADERKSLRRPPPLPPLVGLPAARGSLSRRQVGVPGLHDLRQLKRDGRQGLGGAPVAATRPRIGGLGCKERGLWQRGTCTVTT